MPLNVEKLRKVVLQPLFYKNKPLEIKVFLVILVDEGKYKINVIIIDFNYLFY